MFTILNNGLQACKQCFGTNDHLVVEAPRSSKINLIFHPEATKLTHNEFNYNNDMGFYRPTGKIVEWKLVDGKFIALTP